MSTQAQLQPVSEAAFLAPRQKRLAIGHTLIDRCSFNEAIRCITRHALSAGRPTYVVTPNAQHIVLLSTDRRLRDIYREAGLVVPDGFSLLIAARVLGSKFPERVSGVDLFVALCGSAAQTGLKVFLLGGRPGSAELAASTMQERFPGLQVETCCPPFGFESSELELARISHAIRRFQPDVLFVALGAPKQEYWIYDHGQKLGVPVCLGVGGSFELATGIVPRAPRWVQRIGCEWMYRLWQEPRRLWRRYSIGNVQFASIVLQQLLLRSMHALMGNKHSSVREKSL